MRTNLKSYNRFSDQRQAMKTVNWVVKMKVSTWKSNCRQLLYSPSSEECGPQCGIVQDLFFKASLKHDYHFQIDSGGFWKWVGWWNITILRKVAGSRSGGVWPVPAKVKSLHWVFLLLFIEKWKLEKIYYWQLITAIHQGESPLLVRNNQAQEMLSKVNQDLVIWTTTD